MHSFEHHSRQAEDTMQKQRILVTAAPTYHTSITEMRNAIPPLHGQGCEVHPWAEIAQVGTTGSDNATSRAEATMEADDLEVARSTGLNTAITARREPPRKLIPPAKRRKAGPGASGWRNSYICDIASASGGVPQLRMWTNHWAAARLPDEIVAMWIPRCVAPQDCGKERSDDSSRQKLRPIALEEALVKLQKARHVTLKWKT